MDIRGHKLIQKKCCVNPLRNELLKAEFWEWDFSLWIWNQVKQSADMKQGNIHIDNIKVPEIHKMRSEMLGN